MSSQEAIVWIPQAITALLSTILHFFMLKHELKVRKDGGVKFTNNYSKYTSLSCLISGFMVSLLVTVSKLNIFCIFSGFGTYICTTFQGGAMGFYQLSRLYYTFANSSILSNKGYPKWVFIIMTIIGVFCMVIIPFSRIYMIAPICGIINRKLEYNEELIAADDEYYIYYQFIWYIWVFIFICLDIVTLLLYVCKMMNVKRYKTAQPIVYQSIMNILSKILILSLFYQITAIIYIFVANNFILFAFFAVKIQTNLKIISAVTGLSLVNAMSVSMYLMMDHNRDQYVKFLKIVYRLKLHYLCLCCGRMVVQQLEDIEMNMLKVSESSHNVRGDQNVKETTTEQENTDNNQLEGNGDIHVVVVNERVMDQDQRIETSNNMQSNNSQNH